MKAKVVFPNSIWQSILDFLFSKPADSEHAGFVVAGIGKSDDTIILLARDFIPLRGVDLVSADKFGIQVEPKKLINLINVSYAKGHCLIEVHSHPWDGKAAMSKLDVSGVGEMVNYLSPEFPEAPYAAMVFTKNSFEAVVWFRKRKVAEAEVKIVGQKTSLFKTSQAGKLEKEKYDRQIRLFGSETQKKITLFKVGIVGVGGTGTHIVQQLAYLGVKSLILVDPDKVERSNLNRLVGASAVDIGRKKVDVAERFIKSVNAKAVIEKVPRSVLEKESIEALKEADFIFGCVDNDAARLIVNGISVAYLIPFIDVGTDINLTREGNINSAGGRVYRVLPEGPCLLCPRGEIDITEVSEGLLSEEELEARKTQGYARGQIVSPAIISINGAVASHAVTEFVFYSIGLDRPVKSIHEIYGCFTKYLKVRKRPGCIHCTGYFGRGDKAPIEDYGRNKIKLVEKI